MFATGFKKDIGRLIRALASTVLVAVVFLNIFAIASAHATPHFDATVSVSDVQQKTCTEQETAKRMTHGHHQNSACELPDERHHATCSVAVCCFQGFNAALVLSVERHQVSVELVRVSSAEVVSRSELPHDRPPRSI
jgi:hypothetical protein